MTGQEARDDQREALIADAHARYHCEPGNMLWASDCIWEECTFWEIATFTEQHLRSAARKHPKPEIIDDYEAGYGEGFHHGRSTPAERAITDELVEKVAGAMWWQEFGYDRAVTWEQRVQQELDHRTDPSWSGPVARYRRLARTALEAALRVPVGEGEQ